MAKGVKRTIGIYINGKEVENSIKSITSAMLLLTNRQKQMTIGSDEYVKHAEKIKGLRSVLEEHNKSLKTTFSMLDTAVGTFKQLARDAAAMDDVYAMVRKTTGLTRDAVLELNEEFKKMDTRTSREELNKLAETAGRLGITTKETIMQFVAAGNIAAVIMPKHTQEKSFLFPPTMLITKANSTKTTKIIHFGSGCFTAETHKQFQTKPPTATTQERSSNQMPKFLPEFPSIILILWKFRYHQ